MSLLKPARSIPLALFQEVKEHLHEMMAAGAERPSQSPYSSNVVIARKRDGRIRFSVDFRKLINKTIKDVMQFQGLKIVYIYLPEQDISPN